MNTSQNFEDKLYALKYLISGKGIPYVVLKATTSELIGPKRKHLNYLVHISHEPNVSVPNMVKHLMLRSRFPDWQVSFKAIITIHHLMTYGNEKFLQNLASSTGNNRSFDRLCSYADRSTPLGHNMSIFLRRYARYINNKIQTYRSLGVDFCRIGYFQGDHKTDNQDSYDSDYHQYDERKQNALKNSYYVCNEDSTGFNIGQTTKLKTMPPEQLLRVLPIIQNQFDLLLAFDASADDLCNGIIISAFTMLYKDFVKLYIVYQGAIIRLLELYFSTRIHRRAKEMLDLYKRFLIRMDKVSDFLPVVDLVGMDKSDLPNLSRAPNLSLKTLEDHLEKLSRKYCNKFDQSEATTSLLNYVKPLELPRFDYQSLGKPRRRSLRASSSCVEKHNPMNTLTPVITYNRRSKGIED